MTSADADPRTLSHPALLDAYDESIPGMPEEKPLRDEILRRMDSAGTSRRLDVEPDPAGYQK